MTFHDSTDIKTNVRNGGRWRFMVLRRFMLETVGCVKTGQPTVSIVTWKKKLLFLRSVFAATDYLILFGQPLTTCQVWVCHTHTILHKLRATFLQSLQSWQVPVSSIYKTLKQRYKREMSLRNPRFQRIPSWLLFIRVPSLLGSWSADTWLPVRPSRKESTNWQWSSPYPVWSPIL